MTPEAADYLRHGQLSLKDAQSALDAGIYRVAAREAYIAALNAARALIFEKLTKAPKRHSSTHALFHQLVRDGFAMDRSVLDVLAQGFEVKLAVDYGPYEAFDDEKARDLMKRATIFVAAVGQELAK